jgi:hypothetical protein
MDPCGAQTYADDLQIELIEGAGDFLADDRPETVAARILTFFGGGSD